MKKELNFNFGEMYCILKSVLRAIILLYNYSITYYLILLNLIYHPRMLWRRNTYRSIKCLQSSLFN